MRHPDKPSPVILAMGSWCARRRPQLGLRLRDLGAWIQAEEDLATQDIVLWEQVEALADYVHVPPAAGQPVVPLDRRGAPGPVHQVRRLHGAVSGVACRQTAPRELLPSH